MGTRLRRVEELELVPLTSFATGNGDIVIGDSSTLKFTPQRVYYLYDVPSGASRGGHAHKNLSQVIVAVSGSFEVQLFDGVNWRCFLLSQPNIGLYVSPGFWRELRSFSGGSVCLVLASSSYQESDYIRDFGDFVCWRESFTAMGRTS
jgi:dTDP-4-dehydrorhamnose 3,5-epimerase-like enzyme